MEDLMDEAKRLAENVNEQERKKLIDGLRDLSYSIETPDDTMNRIMYLVSGAHLSRFTYILIVFPAPTTICGSYRL